MFIDDTGVKGQPDGVAMIAGIRQTVGNFLGDEDGAVTVDWVVLTAAVVGLGLLIAPLIGQNTVDLAGDIAADVDEVRIYQYTQSSAPGGSGSGTGTGTGTGTGG
jgi:hypothetical protein